MSTSEKRNSHDEVQLIARATIISEKRYAQGSGQNIKMITHRAGVLIKKAATIVQTYMGQP